MDKDLKMTLKTLNLKVTPKRLAILDILAAESGYLGPEEVWQRMKKRFKSIGLPTVYRNLEHLANGGVLIKIIHPDRKLYYYLCRNASHHHHFICVSCKKVEDLSFCGASEIEKEVKNNLKGHVVSHLLQVYGLCEGCSISKTISS
ncbi:MAG: Fur family transcriptional regulator [Syntrophorhabdaceae bacterium]|jgi:Fe2+ or Zn2+ uptake regulation protein|nr:Fur family transcriptional regulator [Syntrophorhabdaceae bacterium]MDD5243798.1 Fur family transcriptional regulator [Syntrophorhabdaceae bacterium]